MEKKEHQKDITETRQQFAARLRELRLQRGYRQEEVARLLGVSRSAYTYYENAITLPSVFKLRLLAKMYDLPMEDFFVGVEEE